MKKMLFALMLSAATCCAQLPIANPGMVRNGNIYVETYRTAQYLSADSNKIELSQEAGDTNVVFAVTDLGTMPDIADSQGNTYTPCSSSGSLFSFISTGIKGGPTAITVQNARAICVVELIDANYLNSASFSGLAFSSKGDAAWVAVTADHPAAVFWAIAVVTPGSVSVDHHILKSMLDGKCVVGVDSVESGVFGIRIPFADVRQAWNMVQVTFNKTE
jgi:hypothetical protein